MKLPLILLLFIALNSFAQTTIITSRESISKAIVTARTGDTLLLSDGTYKETIALKRGITLKAKNIHKVIIKGDGRGEVISMSQNTTIDGIVITGGNNGIYSNSVNCVIINSIIKNNRQSGLLAIKKLPLIRNSAFIFNGSAGIKGTGIGSSSGEIKHVTIARNGFGGINIDGQVPIIMEDCIIYKNPTFGAKIPHKSIIANSIIFPTDREFIKGNINKKPLFISLRTNPSNLCLTETSPGKKASQDGSDIGINWK